MVIVNSVKPGMTYLYENNLLLCIELSLNKTAMRKMIVKIKSKNWRTGAITDVSFNGGDKVEEVYLDKAKVQYLYDSGDVLIFMDQTNFEQTEIPKSRLVWELNFITEGVVVELTRYGEEILGISLPPKVELEITYTESATKGDTVKTALKDATLSTGYHLKVPQFVNTGDHILVRTDSGAYDSRA
jgi:elongation factor P